MPAETIRLPRALQAQAEAVAQIEQQMAQAAANPPPSPAVPLEALVQPPAPAPAPAVAEPVVSTPAPVPTPPDKPTYEELDHKVRTLQGMFKAEMSRRVEAEVASLKASNNDLMRQLSDLQTKLSQAPAAPAAPDPKDVEAFGAELVSMVQRQASTAIATAIKDGMASIEQRLTRLEGATSTVGQTLADTREEAFWAQLRAAVPNVDAVNTDQRFHDWLAEIDPVYGVARQAALSAAGQAFDATRAIAIFKTYLATAAATTKPATPTPNKELEAQVAPSRTGGSSAPVATPQFVKESAIAGFWNDMRLGKYRGREAEAAQLEVEIDKAVAEGRVLLGQ